MLPNSANPYLCMTGGVISGDYEFRHADIQITEESSIIMARLQPIQ